MKAGLIVLGLWLLAGPGHAFSAGLPDGLPTAFDSLDQDRRLETGLLG